MPETVTTRETPAADAAGAGGSAPPSPRGRRLTRALVGVTVAAIAATWLYVLLPFPKPRPDDQLDDLRFAEVADVVCVETIERLNRLPIVTQESPPDELAAVVTASNDELEVMVAELRSIAPTGGRDGRLVGRWLDDWDQHLVDRERWVERVRAGDVGPFTETEVRDGYGVTGYLTEFAEVNAMPACGAPEYRQLPDR
ncbi:MAG: hypothetical protein ACRD29_04550 [Acidimicrobiales bacterium]